MIKTKNKLNPLPLILIILDGWGIDKPNKGNAITLAKTTVINKLKKQYPSTEIYAHGKHVGLLNNYDGNSEAGHSNIGAGRIIEQDHVRINTSIKKGVFFKNPALLSAFKHVKKNKSKLHLMGLFSIGDSPHIYIDHIKTLIDFTRKNKIKDACLHLFTDGRDSPTRSALEAFKKMEKKWLENERICTIIGRFYAMDRINKWDRIELAYNALVLGEGTKASSAQNAIEKSYARNESDEFIKPSVIHDKNNNALPRISDNDAVIFFNLRSDRAREISKAFVQKDFNKKNPGSFKRKKVLKNLKFVSMTDFGEGLEHVDCAYKNIKIDNALPSLLQDLSQLYIAEKEKYAHVTYFFNGGYDAPIGGEDRLLIPSPKVKTYDKTPGMKSKELARIVIKNVSQKICKIRKPGSKLDVSKNKKCEYDFTVLNFASPDMIGHTGNLKAGVECAQIVDECVGKIVDAYLKNNGTVIITADHGNLEEMINLKTGDIDTEHSSNKVPFIIINNNLTSKIKLKKNGKLADIAPTILEILGRKKPKEMTGTSLIMD